MVNHDAQEPLKAMAINARSGVHEKLADLWWFFVLRGVFALTLGVFALFWPNTNASLLLMAVGLYCIADAVITLFSALRQPAFREHFLQAFIVMAVGIVLVAWPDATLRSLLMLLGAAVVLLGISQVMAARRLPNGDIDRRSAMKIAIATVLVGTILVMWPGSGTVVISWVIGIGALLIGALLIFLGSRFRKLSNRAGAPADRISSD